MNIESPGVRYAEIERETRETRVQVVLDLDGGSRQDISTGIAFFDHMLAQLAFHGQLDVGIICEGDLLVDDHHTVEDVGIVVGHAIHKCLHKEDGIARFGSCTVPMDDALVMAAIDVSGRGQLHYDIPFTRERLGALSTENVREFFKVFATHAGITLHLRKVAGENEHHICEAAFKAVGLALYMATRRIERQGSMTNSVKGKRDLG